MSFPHNHTYTDTGDEVILVDTGLPAGTPEEVPDENSPIFTGKDICSYMEAFAALGYKPEQVTKIIPERKRAKQRPAIEKNSRSLSHFRIQSR